MNTNERNFIGTLIQEYRIIHSNLGNLEDNLKKLESELKIENCGKLKSLGLEIIAEVEKLEVYRQTELKFWDEVSKKYGPGKFDPISMEYKLTKNV